MRPFDLDQEAKIQEMLNDNFSRYGKIDVSESHMRNMTTTVLNISAFRSKDNFLFYDCRSPNIGLEFKKRGFKNPISQIGKLVEITMTRTIDHVPTENAEETISYIASRYNTAIDEFRNECNNNVWFAGALYSKDTLVYYHEPVNYMDISKITGKWAWNDKTYNFYARDIETGEKVFTYLTKGEKLQMKLRVPSKDNVHIFRAQKSHTYQRISMDVYTAFMNKHANDGNTFEDIIRKIAA